MSEIGREESGGRVRVARTNYLHEKEGEKRIGEGQKGVVYTSNGCFSRGRYLVVGLEEQLTG